MALFKSGAKTVFYGVVLIGIAIVFFLSGLGAFRSDTHIFGDTADTVVAFVVVIAGVFLVCSEVGKPGEPKYEVTLKNAKLQ
jgi:hypothetical protein